MNAERKRMDTSKASGSTYAFLPIQIPRLFRDSKSIDSLDPEGVRIYQALIRHAAELNLQVIGSTSVWIFPEAIDAPILPVKKSYSLTITEVSKTFIIPPLDDEKYLSLSKIRNSIWEKLATTFPEIRLWLIGIEENYEFVDTQGKPLDVTSFSRFVCDSLYGIRESLLSAHPANQTIAHFLGYKECPIRFHDRRYSVDKEENDDVVIQPKELFEKFAAEMSSRDRSFHEFYDLSIHQLDPTLLEDRLETVIPPWIPKPQSSRPFSLRIETNPPPGWNVYNLINFNFTSTDLIASPYTNWGPLYLDWNTFVPPGNLSSYTQPIDVGVNYPGYAYLSTKQTEKYGPAARSQSTLDFIPNEHFEQSYTVSSTVRYQWTAVVDFFPNTIGQQYPNQTENGHAVVGIRVNNVIVSTPPELPIWVNSQNQYFDLTRYACTLYPKDATHPNVRGILQLSNKYIGPGQNQNTMVTYAPPSVEFTISEDPWVNTTTKYRLQIYEQEVLLPFTNYWQKRWRAEVLKYTSLNPESLVSIGSSEWIKETSITEAGYEIPPLVTTGNLSSLIFAFVYNPVCEMKVQRTGTAYFAF